MKKIGLIILAYCAVVTVKAQPVIKPQQYQILIERTVMHNSSYQCFRWSAASSGQLGGNCFSTGNPNGITGYCFEQDPTCDYAGPSKGWDKLTFKLYKGANLASTGIADINISADIPKGTTKTYHDTLNLYQSQFDITRIKLELLQSEVQLPYERTSGDPFDIVPIQRLQDSASIMPQGEFFEQTLLLQSIGLSRRYSTLTKVRVIPNLNSSLILPSHDKIKMLATNVGGTAVWEYQDIFSQTWHAVPAGHTLGSDQSTLEISGFDLFGNGYTDRLNTRVSFRVKKSGTSTYSSEVHYTLLLSSPHITAVSPDDLNCYERHEGSMKINFDRALLDGERLNIMLYDTLNRVNYSAFNIEQLAADNSYTWKNELRAGRYMVSLLGKYATGIPYTITTDNRIDTVRNYIALNSVNFEDGFNTPETDDFNAFADFGAYSEATYTGDIRHLGYKELNQPGNIRFAVRVDQDVLCKGTPSGKVTLAASGGKSHFKYSIRHENEAYSPWISFDNNNRGFVSFYSSLPSHVPFSADTCVQQVITNLKAGTYTIRVRDTVDCYVKDKNGEELTFTFKITEPEKGLTVDAFELSPITAAGASNGKIRLQVSGGSPFPTSGQEIVYPLPYQLEWRDSTTNQLITTHTTTFVNNKFESILDNLPHGTYIFRAFDRSYNASDPNNAGCVLELIIPVKEPLPLVVTINQRRPVSCYGDSNGELVAVPSGGIPRDSVGYLFKWFRQNGEIAEELLTADSLIEKLAAGTYRVEITDKYNNTKLSDPFVLTQPSTLQLQLSSMPASCYSSFDGTLNAVVTGGTPFADPNKAYLYEWSNGAITAMADSVAGGNYLLVVMDSMACVAKDTISVTSPVRVIATPTIDQITCHDKNDGVIAVTVAGGVAPYTYEWNTGATTATISNLDSGRYWYAVRDANGCFDTDTIVLDQPDTLLLSLGADRLKCIGQTIRLDATVSAAQALNYSWTGPLGIFATTPKVSITNPGTYHVAVSNNRGCMLRDTIEVTTIDSVINTDYVVSTQAYVNESVHLINISRPQTDSVKWIVPSLGNTIRVLQQNNSKCELIFADTGRYEVTMRAYFSSGCIEDSTKAIHVIRRDGNVLGGQSNAFLKAYAVIYPNPNNGTFKVDLEFSEITSARLRLINTLNNVMIDDRQIQGAKDYLVDYNIGTGLVSGTYILVIDAAKGSFVYKVVIVQ
jgi:hypothetical protein